MIDSFNKAIKLAKKWRSFSKEARGWNTVDWGNGLVRCYFADDSDHTTVRFGKYPEQIDVIFHSPIRFGDLTINSIRNIDTILSECERLLHTCTEHREKQSADEVAQAKKARLEKLEEEIRLLKGDAA